MQISEAFVTSSSPLSLVLVINLCRGVKTIRLTDFVKLPRQGADYWSSKPINRGLGQTGAGRSAAAVTMNHCKIGRTSKLNVKLVKMQIEARTGVPN